MKNAIEIVKHEEYVVKMGEDRISLDKTEALKLYNELQDVLGLEVPVLEEITYIPPVCPCIPIPYMPPSPWWEVDPYPWYRPYPYNYITAPSTSDSVTITTTPLTNSTTYNTDEGLSYTDNVEINIKNNDSVMKDIVNTLNNGQYDFGCGRRER